MKGQAISDRVRLVGAVDWERTLFDSLIPLPHGTSYNAYLVQGSQKTALIDGVDPTKTHRLLDRLSDVPRIDYVIANHAEQDHSGAIPRVLEKYPSAKVMASTKCKSMLIDLLRLPEERIQPVEDGEILSLGDRTLEFIYTPWVHWPETMSTYLREEKILFSCDFFGSHLATSDAMARDQAVVYQAAKRYYAEIMMPFRQPIEKNLDRLASYELSMIAPSHGPVYDQPAFILDAYREWVSAPPKNLVVLPYISMHDSTRHLVEHLIDALIERGVSVQPFEMTITDLGELAMALVDAATIVLGTPVVLGSAHPLIGYAAMVTNLLKPKARYAAFIVSYGWGANTVDKFANLLPGLKLELLSPVACRGLPGDEDYLEIERLAETIAVKHRQDGY